MPEPLTLTGQPFLAYLDGWLGALHEKTLEQVAPIPGETAVFSVDLIKGFCSMGPLASPRVNDIVPANVALFKRAWTRGIRHIVLTQDTHEPDAVEFGSFPPHCIRGSQESETVDEISSLPFYPEMTIIEKNSIHSGLNTGLADLAGRTSRNQHFPDRRRLYRSVRLSDCHAPAPGRKCPPATAPRGCPGQLRGYL